MTKRSVAWTILAIIFASICVCAGRKSVAKADAALVLMNCSEPFTSNTGWSLIVNADGSASITMNTHPTPKIRHFKVPTKELDTFREVAAAQRFFDLGAEYGSHVPDSGKRAITVHIGQKSKTVRLLFLSPTSADSSEVKRALLVWKIARNWFNDAGAADTRAHDKQILDTPSASVPPKVGR